MQTPCFLLFLEVSFVVKAGFLGKTPGMDRTKSVGLRLRAIRVAQKMTQEQFSELLDRSPEAVSNLETGRNLPSVETLVRLSEALNRPLGELFAALDGVAENDPRRVRLEAEIAEKARKLSLRDLKVVAKLIDALGQAE